MDANDVGQGKTHTQAIDKYDAEHGKYECNHGWRLNGPGALKHSAKTGAAANPMTLKGGEGK
jgi:hypothetical protein